jgi:hypothetical protein
MVMDLIAVFPESPSPELARTLDMAGFRWKSFASADAVINGRLAWRHRDGRRRHGRRMGRMSRVA